MQLRISGFHSPAISPKSIEAATTIERLGRLKPGVSIQQAQTQLTAIAERLSKSYPATNKDKGVFVTQLVNFNVRQVKTTLYILLAAVALMLLMACANIANLLLARGTSRIREMAIRAAPGSRAWFVSYL